MSDGGAIAIVFCMLFIAVTFFVWLAYRDLCKPERLLFGQVRESRVDESGRWLLTVHIADERTWLVLTGRYMPWRLRIVNVFRALMRKPPLPSPYARQGFSIGGTAAREDT